MPAFMYLYRGPGTPGPAPTADEAAARLAAFQAWMDRLGPALLDPGRPFGPGRSVRDDGTEGPAEPLIGYSVVEAADLPAACALTAGLPVLAGDDGTYSVEVVELLAM